MISLSEQAYEHLKNMIVHNKLNYGEIYSETKLAKEIGISRTPFRDAIHHLVQEGYIDIIPSKGFQLHQLTKQDVIETFQVRSALECFCTVEIAKDYQSERSKTVFENLSFCLEKMREIMNSSRSIEDFCKYDFQFHTEIIDYLENNQFTTVYGGFLYRMKRLAALSLSHERRMEEACKEHQAILDTMRSGNTKNIYEITMTHMDIPKWSNLADL
ncbi:DNA-binding GntR family transcriptional regulator [Aequitasia blattaphilus]|uniref:GntR family transcriptional regulator n=1 Tax=Aequitasia blattaphilus TaxID=2949332 RepID=A0ABT1EGZ8_9FIRM|nr:GntR family transcriptional regulator [Aequitasia blattaphilus]MCP1103702.1 GntR family transcriptional regulator [Aequitasia blattaphilus]MCR8616342.1 GntR family transcriptional regulator [Aequitasia blattaphilus]